jgi:membrane protein
VNDHRSSGEERWHDVRKARLEEQSGRVRRWFTEQIDHVEDRLPPKAVDVIERLRDREVLLYAGGLAFYSLVSLVPSLLLVAWIAGSILGEDRIERLAEQIAENAPGEAEIEEFVQSLLDVGTRVGVTALAAAIWPATAFGSGLVRAFDAMSIDEDPSMHGLRGRARALVVLVVLPVFVLGAFAAVSVSASLAGEGALWTVVGWTLAVVSGALIAWVAVIALYEWFGPADMSFGPLAKGAAVTAAGIAIISPSYVVYLSYGTNWEERVAGTGLAALVLLCLYLYLANLLLLAGYAVALAADPGHSALEDAEDADDADRDVDGDREHDEDDDHGEESATGSSAAAARGGRSD